MACVKTGAQVLIAEYKRVAPADVHQVGDCMVVRFPGNFEECARWPDEGPAATHTLVLGLDNYWNKKAGLAVVPASQLEEIKP